MTQPDEFLATPIDTGLVTATVMTPAAIQAAKALVNLPADLEPVMLARLARDIAYDVGTLPVILAKYKLTQAHYEFLREHNAFFRSTLESQINEWQSIKNTQDRLRLQAAAALEEQFPTIASRMGRQTEDLRDVVEAAKLFAKVAGVDSPEKQHGAAGERFTITIDLGAEKLVVGVNDKSEQTPIVIDNADG